MSDEFKSGHGINGSHGEDFTAMGPKQTAAVHAMFGHPAKVELQTANVSQTAGKMLKPGDSPSELLRRAHAGKMPILGAHDVTHEAQTGISEDSGAFRVKGFGATQP